MELTINVKGLDVLAEALCKLAQALQSPHTPLTVSGDTIQQAISTVQAGLQTPTYQSVPVQQAPAVQPSIPTTPPVTHVAQEITLEQLQLGLSSLVDANKMDVVQQIMANHGVPAVTMLDKSQYQSVASALREAGARL